MSPTPFDIAAPLPTGTTLLEASAGTGKTWTVGALVARYVAEGQARLDEMLVITFGRAASQELRERVRAQLVEAEREITRPGATSHPNAVVALLADGDTTVVAERRDRLRAALADFDHATITTTHGFCETVLRSLGTVGDADGGARLVEDVDDLLVQVVDDLYLAGFVADANPAFSRSEALELARTVAGDPGAVLVPLDAEPGSPAARRAGFARVVRERLELRKQALGLLTFDDLLSRLDDALEAPDAPARGQMRRRWRVVLVDEFQDTDPVQWSVLERAFHGHATMILIGDPKQAIYAFRGGDVVTYLRAGRVASQEHTLATNWRSDGPLVDALQTTFAGAALGDPKITVHPVGADHAGSRLHGAPRPAPLRLRAFRREGLPLTASDFVVVGAVRDRIAHDLAADVAELLASDATFGRTDGSGPAPRPVEAGDVAVLVATRNHAELVQRALAAHGIPAVLGGGTNVFRSAAADEWLVLLEAMESPHRSARVRAAALTDFFGHSAAELATSDDDLTAAVAGRLRELVEVLRDRGVAAVLEATSGGGALAARVLARPDGRRRMTDVRHVGQLLHDAAVRDGLGLAALLHWLRFQRDETAEASERTRRLDSDAAAVQIVTVHASKGLQYPVVYLPFLFDRWLRPEPVPRFHAGADLHRALDVGGQGGPHWRESQRQAAVEDAGESLRLLYVAMTRAQSQVVAWWAPSGNAAHAALHRLLFRPDPTSPVVPDAVPVPGDTRAEQVLEAWAERGGPALEWVEEREAVSPPTTDVDDHLAVRTFTRDVDTTWRRTSYSGLTRLDDHAPAVGSEPSDAGTLDEEDVATPTPSAGSADAGAVVSPMAELPTGAAFGSLVHGVLEEADFTAADLRAELVDVAAAQAAYWDVDASPEAVADALVAVSRTPLGPLADDLTLETLLQQRQLTEMEFELPLAGGDHPATRAGDASAPRLGDLASLLDTHLPADDPVRAFVPRLRSPALAEQPLRGYLTGSIDLVLRLPDGRCLVVDHKTNWLGGFDAPLTLEAYTPAALAEAFTGSTYPLQALLYSVVVHRFLRWRQPGYRPEQHLGGVLYLYVRGMAGPDTPRVDGHPCGVLAWQPPAALVVALSDLLDGARPDLRTEGGAA